MKTTNHRAYFSLILLVSVLCGCSRAQTQQDPPAKPIPTRTPLEPVPIDSSYSFIAYDSNQIVIGSDSTLWRQFAEKWFRVTQNRHGRISILHIGSSHVQGGMLPHRIRRNILLPFTDFVSDRGMIFPYAAANKCNNPFDYKVTRNRPLILTRNVYKEPVEQLGLCGIAVTAEDTMADIGIRLTEADISWGTNKVIVFGESRGGVVPLLSINRGENLTTTDNCQNIMEPTRIDSVRRRYIYELSSYTDSFHIILPCQKGQSFALTGVYLANDEPGISVHSIGVNGASLNDYNNKCPYFTTDLRLLKPDLVIFGIGINDASGTNFDTAVFRRSYLRLIDSIRSVNPSCAFLFITNNDSYRYARKKYTVNNNGPLARETFYRLAEETGGAVWDQFTIMGGLTSMQTWYQNSLAQKDRVHFTRIGYELLGDLLSNALFATLTHFKTATVVVQEESLPLNPEVSPLRSDTVVNRKALFPKRVHGGKPAAADTNPPVPFL